MHLISSLWSDLSRRFLNRWQMLNFYCIFVVENIKLDKKHIGFRFFPYLGVQGILVKVHPCLQVTVLFPFPSHVISKKNQCFFIMRDCFWNYKSAFFQIWDEIFGNLFVIPLNFNLNQNLGTFFTPNTHTYTNNFLNIMSSYFFAIIVIFRHKILTCKLKYSISKVVFFSVFLSTLLFKKISAVRLGQKILKQYVRVRISLGSYNLVISLTFARNSNGSHGTVGKTAGFWSGR